MLKRKFAAIQITIGLIGMLLVAVSYVTFSDQLREALSRVDRVADSGEFQLEQSANLLTDFKQVAADLERSTIAHRQTIDSAIVSTERLSSTIARWQSEANAFAEISRDASQVVNGLQEQLPVKIPKVDVSTRSVQFKRPEVSLDSEQFTVKYPTIEVDLRRETIDLGVKKIELKYPVGLTTKEQNKQVRIADIPTITLVDETVEVPQFSVSHQLLLESEKALLAKTSEQLRATSTSLTNTAGSLSDLRRLMAEDLSNSLHETKRNLNGASAQLRQLHVERIPSVVTKLDDQRSELHNSRAALTNLPDLVRMGFLVFGLIPLSVLLSGLGNLSVARAAAG